MKLTVNAGHCPGLDSGAVGPTGVQEADVAKAVAEKVCQRLTDMGHEVLFVQENELETICQQANDFGSDRVVSIHCNSAENPQANGVEAFTTRGETGADPIASSILECINAEFPFLSLRADYSDGDPDKEAGFYVLRYTDAPAVLVEMAFISNPEEEALLGSQDGQDGFAKAIANGLVS